jgi:hypothetical protein
LGLRSFTLRLQTSLTRQPGRFEAFVDSAWLSDIVCLNASGLRAFRDLAL